MLILDDALRAWGTPQFEEVLKRQLMQLVAQLPLQQALTQGSMVLDTPISVLLLTATESASMLDLRVGIFYQSIIAGCSCANDPTPVSENTEYCVLHLAIARSDAVTHVSLADEEEAA